MDEKEDPAHEPEAEWTSNPERKISTPQSTHLSIALIVVALLIGFTAGHVMGAPSKSHEEHDAELAKQTYALEVQIQQMRHAPANSWDCAVKETTMKVEEVALQEPTGQGTYAYDWQTEKQSYTVYPQMTMRNVTLKTVRENATMACSRVIKETKE